MAKSYRDYFPSNDAEQQDFFDNFREQFPPIATTLGLTEAQITLIVDGVIASSQKYTDVADAKEVYDGKIAAKEEYVPDFMTNTFRPFVAQIKTNDNYTDEMGALLHIVGTSTPFDPNAYVAEGTLVIQQNKVTFRFKKAGATAINIYGRKKGEGEFRKITTVTNSPYAHTFELTDGKPETWEFYLQGLLKNEEIGTPTDTLVAQLGLR